MPRKARIDAPGALHHIIIRGVDRMPIFKDAKDNNRFIKRLGRVLEETSTPCYAWALMPNHVHLLLKTGTVPMATVMRRLLTGYAQQFNRRYNRHGHLFQNRYKSILCEEDAYLLELVRYIHLNPLRGGLVDDLIKLAAFPYCGHSGLLSKLKYTWQDTDYVLRFFGETANLARKEYLKFIFNGIELGRRPELVGGGLVRSAGGWSALKSSFSEDAWIKGDERILGCSDFVESTLNQAREDFEQKTYAQLKGLDLKTLIEKVVEHFNVDLRTIKSPSKQRTAAKVRSVICYLAVRKLRISGADVARELSLTPSAVSKSVIRGQGEKRTVEIEKLLFD